MERREGVVASFDEHAGLGVVTSEDGHAFAFHCTQIAGGSRRIEVATAVTFEVGPGGRGRWEAFDLQPGTWLCPVCGARNDGAPRSYEICPRCDWEDDPVQYDDPAYTGGANHLSLNDARAVTGHRG